MRTPSTRSALISRPWLALLLGVSALGACKGDEDAGAAKTVVRESTVEECKLAVQNYVDCHKQKVEAGESASKLGAAEAQAKLDSITDVAGCQAVLETLQAEGFPSCWPS